MVLYQTIAYSARLCYFTLIYNSWYVGCGTLPPIEIVKTTPCQDFLFVQWDEVSSMVSVYLNGTMVSSSTTSYENQYYKNIKATNINGSI